ncbi:MAG: phosphate propanoyltransferase [Planctomycetota bacterium]|jgi:putative phosphotransacetylase
MSSVNIPMPREQLERIVRQVVRERLSRGAPVGVATLPYAPNLVANVSARHMHVCPADLARLFGPGAELTVYRWLYQPGEFASEQTVTVFGPRKRMIERVRILGPARDYSQAEISFTDAIALGIDAPVRPSGQTDGTPGAIVVGPAGVLELSQGVIRAERHVHMSPTDADCYGFHDRQYVRLHVESNCSMTFDRVLCRVDPRFLLEAHLDTDEGNACDLPNATGVELLA